MKCLACIFLVLTASAFATGLGDTYDEVIAELGKPKSETKMGTRCVLQYSEQSIVLKNGVVTTIRSADGTVEATSTNATSNGATKFSSPQEEMDWAVARVKEIINQHPPSSKYDFGTPGYIMKNAWTGWYAEGAVKPDFNTVDVRQTQQLPFLKYTMVTSDLNLGTIFPASELEFNPSLQYFYTDRNWPKKRLSESEMVEVNRLYRVIARCEPLVGELPAKPTRP